MFVYHAYVRYCNETAIKYKNSIQLFDKMRITA